MDQKIIKAPISRLGLSEDFLVASKAMGFETLADVLAVDPMELVKKDGFNYSWLGELVVLLSRHKLLYLLQPLPGNIPG